MRIRTGTMLVAALLVAACGAPRQRADSPHLSSPAGGGYLPGDGPGSEDAARLHNVPDAVPRNEPLHRYANRPYEALGVRYVPLSAAGGYRERGVASWYGKKFHGQRTSSGEVYNMYGMSAAHKTLPIPSYARVTNLRNGKSVIVRVNDRGPFLHGRILDVSYAAAYKLDIVGAGSEMVEVESIAPEQGEVTTQPLPAEPVQVVPLKAESVPPAQAPMPAPRNDSAQSATGGSNVFLQLGSFRSPQGAEGFYARMRDELAGFGKQLTLYTRDGLTRVHLGPYRTPEEARASADKLEARLGFKPFVSIH